MLIAKLKLLSVSVPNCNSPFWLNAYFANTELAFSSSRKIYLLHICLTSLSIPSKLSIISIR